MNKEHTLWFTECATCSSTCSVSNSADVFIFTEENEWPSSECCNAPVIFRPAN